MQSQFNNWNGAADICDKLEIDKSYCISHTKGSNNASKKKKTRRRKASSSSAASSSTVSSSQSESTPPPTSTTSDLSSAGSSSSSTGSASPALQTNERGERLYGGMTLPQIREKMVELLKALIKKVESMDGEFVFWFWFFNAYSMLQDLSTLMNLLMERTPWIQRKIRLQEATRVTVH